jgi:hypothetical protein
LKLPLYGFAGAAHFDPLRNFLPNRFAASFKRITQRIKHVFLENRSQRPPAKQVAWIFGHRPKRRKRTAVFFALSLPPGAKHPGFMARINGDDAKPQAFYF